MGGAISLRPLHDFSVSGRKVILDDDDDDDDDDNVDNTVTPLITDTLINGHLQ
jgi:hypothetical protein